MSDDRAIGKFASNGFAAQVGQCLAAGPPARIAPRSVESSARLRLLPFVLSVIAGCSDVISFVGLGGLPAQAETSGR